MQSFISFFLMNKILATVKFLLFLIKGELLVIFCFHLWFLFYLLISLFLRLTKYWDKFINSYSLNAEMKWSFLFMSKYSFYLLWI